MDLIEIEDARQMQPVNEIPLEHLLRQHRTRYVVKTSQGDVVLKYIGALRRRTVELNLTAQYPDYDSIRRNLREASALVKKFPDAPQYKADQNRLAAILEPTFYQYFAACFDRPRASAEQVLAFADALPPEEWRLLRVFLLQLISTRPAGEVASVMVVLCNKYGVKMADDLTLESMTAQQYAVLDQVAGDEVKAIKGAMR